MFLGGAGLADMMLYCREQIYPLGLPNGLSRVVAAVALLAKLFLRAEGELPPARPRAAQRLDA